MSVTYQKDQTAPPFHKSGASSTNVTYAATGTTHLTIALPSSHLGEFVTLRAVTEDVWVLMGDHSGVEVDRAATSGDKLGWIIKADTEATVRVPSQPTWASLEAGGVGYVLIRKVSTLNDNSA